MSNVDMEVLATKLQVVVATVKAGGRAVTTKGVYAEEPTNRKDWPLCLLGAVQLYHGVGNGQDAARVQPLLTALGLETPDQLKALEKGFMDWGAQSTGEDPELGPFWQLGRKIAMDLK